MFAFALRFIALISAFFGILMGFGLIMSFATGRLQMPVSNADMQPVGLVIFGAVALIFVFRKLRRA